MPTLASLQQVITDNYREIESLLAMKNYDAALVSMENRLRLIDQLLDLVASEPALKRDAEVLSATLAIQEESMMTMASDHHQAIFKELSSIGLASRARQIYGVNSKEF